MTKCPKNPADGFFFSLQKMLAQTSAKLAPQNQKSYLRPCMGPRSPHVRRPYSTGTHKLNLHQFWTLNSRIKLLIIIEVLN